MIMFILATKYVPNNLHDVSISQVDVNFNSRNNFNNNTYTNSFGNKYSRPFNFLIMLKTFMKT